MMVLVTLKHESRDKKNIFKQKHLIPKWILDVAEDLSLKISVQVVHGGIYI